MASDSMSDSMSGATSRAPSDAAQFTAWLDAELGRPLTIVALRRRNASGAASDEPLAGWRDQLAAYPGVRLLTEALDGMPGEEALASVARRDPDALLICADIEDSTDAADGADDWCARILDAAEGLNLFERMLLARYGAGVTRANARAAGYEDGFSPEQPLPDVLAILGREAIARETYRRRGSSPPCYL